MTGIPITYRKSPPVNVSFDFFDYAAGAAYKIYYLAGGLQDTQTATYFLTSNSSYISPRENYGYTLSGTSNVTLNFDLTFQNQLTVAAADAFFGALIMQGGTSNFTFTLTVYHVNAAGTQTSIGTANVTDTNNYSGRIGFKAALTEKTIGAGEKLRINIVFTHTGAGSAVFYYDPSGTGSGTEAAGLLSRSNNDSANILIPFKLDI